MTKTLTFLMSLSIAGVDEDEEGEGKEEVTSSLAAPPSSASPSATVVGVSEASEVAANLKEREREVGGVGEGERVDRGHGGEGRGKEVKAGTTRVCILCFVSFHPREAAARGSGTYLQIRVGPVHNFLNNTLSPTYKPTNHWCIIKKWLLMNG